MISQVFSYGSALKEFCKFPSELLHELIGLSDIPPMARLCYARLYDRAKFDKQMQVKISMQELAQMLGRGIRATQNYLKLLEENGFVSRLANFGKDGYQLPNTIQILIPEKIINKILKMTGKALNPENISPAKKITPINNINNNLSKDNNSNTDKPNNNNCCSSTKIKEKKIVDLEQSELLTTNDLVECYPDVKKPASKSKALLKHCVNN